MMRAFLADLHAASLPFVSRVFRGQRLRRYALVSLALGLLSVLVGAWLAWGSGSFERDLRHELDLEVSVWHRADQTFTEIVVDRDEYEWALEHRQRLLAADDPQDVRMESGPLSSTFERAQRFALEAVRTNAPPQHGELAREAVALLDRYHVEPAPYDQFRFSWHDAGDVKRLRAIVDKELIPDVELYASPLSLREGVGVIGLIAGGVALFVLLVGAPMFAGAQIAQEAHENTLPPLLGTRLTPRGLVLGLTAGPLAGAGLFAAPQLALYALAAVTAGKPVVLPGFILLTMAAALALSMLTQLLGYGMGRRWASGLVGTGLTVLLVISMLIATAIAFELDDDTAGLVTIIPQMGSVHLLVETFAPRAELFGNDALLLDIRMIFAAVAFAVLAMITMRALERRVTGRTQAALLRGEAAVAAITLIGLAIGAMPEFRSDDVMPMYFLSLALLVIPFQVLVMARVPTGDGPAKLRKIPVSGLFAELGSWVGAHALVVLAVYGAGFDFSIGGAFYLAWALGVAALCAVRLAAMPLKPLSAVFVCFSLFTAAVGYGVAAACFASAAYAKGEFFGLFDVSPILGLVQIAVTIAIPWGLVRALQRDSAGLR
jgi:hypothetical protein